MTRSKQDTPKSSTEFDFDLSALEQGNRNRDPIAIEKQVVVDTREQRPYRFTDYPVSTTDRALETGDYSLEGYETRFAVERKSKGDFLKSVTHDRGRFEAELERASTFDVPMAIVVEAPWSVFENNEYERDVSPNSIIGTRESWAIRYNIEWYFEADRSAAQRKTLELLSEWQTTV